MKLSIEFYKSYPAKLHGVREQYTKIWLDWKDFQNLVKAVFNDLNTLFSGILKTR